MNTVTTAETINKIQIVESNPTVSITVSSTTVTLDGTGSAVQVSTQETPVTVNASTITAVAEVGVVETRVIVETPELSLPRILDSVRTDAADTVLSYDGSNQLTTFTNADVTRDITYNQDGTIATVTTTTRTETVTKTFGYTNGILTSITVS